MTKSKNNQRDIKKRMGELRLSLNKIYVKCGNTEEVVRISQELDKYILLEQKKKLKEQHR
ncbi:aspartyl-phosphate phosphatase Spo0E family protein [Wukongibacter sp. M2B1]|uniref:aspartyl-phosphate phosphatase Spo0E family protein n=1 Tax=Wukongibacter sp. M2B1 TaxID=3088895 RepID=UPI003D793875